MSKFVLLCNDSVYYNDDGKNVFDLEELKGLIVEWNGGKNEFRLNEEEEEEEEEEDVVDVDKLMEMCEDRKVCVYEEDMVEMGDDFVELMLIELKE